MKKLILILLLSIFTSISYAKEWTVLMYFSGDNNLSDVLTVQMKTLSSMKTDNQINLLIQFDGNKHSDSLRLEVGNEVTIHQQNLEYDMGEEETLAEFVQWGRNKFPAKKYALVINGHGRGIVNLPLADGGGNSLSMASSPDSSENSVFDEETMTQKLQQVLGEDKIDLLIYAACLMGNLETLMTISPIAKYVLTSEYEIYLKQDYNQDTVTGEGISLKNMIISLNNDPKLTPEILGNKLLQFYKTSYQNFQTEILPGLFKYEKASLALYNLEKIKQVEDLLRETITEVNAITKTNPFKFNALFVKLLSAPRIDSLNYYVDLGLLIHAIDSIFKLETTTKLIEILYNNQSLIVGKTLLYLPDNTAGLSLFFPAERPLAGTEKFESILKSYSKFNFNKSIPLANLITNYLEYVDHERINIIQKIIIKLINNKNQKQLDELLYFMKMEIYLQKQSTPIVQKYYSLIKNCDYSSYYFKKHKLYIEKMLRNDRIVTLS